MWLLFNTLVHLVGLMLGFGYDGASNSFYRFRFGSGSGLLSVCFIGLHAGGLLHLHIGSFYRASRYFVL